VANGYADDEEVKLSHTSSSLRKANALIEPVKSPEKTAARRLAPLSAFGRFTPREKFSAEFC
jgi:hypothetical protein